MSDAISMEGKVALVTGAGSGIGRATARLLARRGAKIAIADVEEEGAAETLESVEREGAEGIVVQVDVADPEAVRRMVEETVDALGRLDCAFNIAGIPWRRMATADYEEQDWDRLMGINLRGIWLCMKREIIQMLGQNPPGGAIVNLSSVLGAVAFRNASAFVTADHGVVGLTKAAAVEYAERGIRVNAVCPSFINTPLQVRTGILIHPEQREQVIQAHPMKRLGEPDEVAEAVVWLASDAASYVTGQALCVDGGYTAQ